MPSIDLRGIVAIATRNNTKAYASRYGPRSLDEQVFGDGKVTLGDRLIDTATSFEEPVTFDEALSALTDLERRRLERRHRTIAGCAERRRQSAELGIGWLSSLAITATMHAGAVSSGGG